MNSVSKYLLLFSILSLGANAEQESTAHQRLLECLQSVFTPDVRHMPVNFKGRYLIAVHSKAAGVYLLNAGKTLYYGLPRDAEDRLKRTGSVELDLIDDTRTVQVTIEKDSQGLRVIPLISNFKTAFHLLPYRKPIDEAADILSAPGEGHAAVSRKLVVEELKSHLKRVSEDLKRRIAAYKQRQAELFKQYSGVARLSADEIEKQLAELEKEDTRIRENQNTLLNWGGESSGKQVADILRAEADRIVDYRVTKNPKLSKEALAKSLKKEADDIENKRLAPKVGEFTNITAGQFGPKNQVEYLQLAYDQILERHDTQRTELRAGPAELQGLAAERPTRAEAHARLQACLALENKGILALVAEEKAKIDKLEEPAADVTLTPATDTPAGPEPDKTRDPTSHF